jgi:hypothetical protein
MRCERCSGSKCPIGKTRSPPSFGAPPTRPRPTNGPGASGAALCATRRRTSQVRSPSTGSCSGGAASTPALLGSLGVWGGVRHESAEMFGERRSMRAELVKIVPFLDKCLFGRDQPLAITAGIDARIVESPDRATTPGFTPTLRNPACPHVGRPHRCRDGIRAGFRHRRFPAIPGDRANKLWSQSRAS